MTRSSRDAPVLCRWRGVSYGGGVGCPHNLVQLVHLTQALAIRCDVTVNLLWSTEVQTESDAIFPSNYPTISLCFLPLFGSPSGLLAFDLKNLAAIFVSCHRNCRCTDMESGGTLWCGARSIASTRVAAMGQRVETLALRSWSILSWICKCASQTRTAIEKQSCTRTDKIT